MGEGNRWQETFQEGIASLLDQVDEDHGLLTAWCVVVERRAPGGSPTIFYYRGPEQAASWLHRGMLRAADELIRDADKRDEDDA